MGHVRAEHGKYVCAYCGKELGCKDTLRRHVKEGHERRRSFHCPCCDSTFARGENLKRHFESLHGKRDYWRCRCGELFLGGSALERHQRETKHRK